MGNQRLIDAAALLEVLKIAEEGAMSAVRYIQANEKYTAESIALSLFDTFEDVINDAPTVDPVRHARWVMGYPITCSGCGGAAPEEEDNDIVYRAWLPDWCPHCGARMDEGEGGGARE